MACKYQYNNKWYVESELKTLYNSVKDKRNFFNTNINQKLRSIGEDVNISVDGFMREKPDLSDSLLDSVGVKTTDTGTYYFTINGHFYNPYKPNTIIEGLSDREKVKIVADTFLNKVGAKVNFVGSLEHDYVAQVNLISKIIDIVDHKQGLDTLTEEAVHIMVGMMRGSSEYANMMTAITNLPIYEQVKKDYADRSDTAIREEAVVKHITNLAISKTLTPQEQKIKNTWWDRIINFFRKLFTREAIDEFNRAAERYVNADITGLNEVSDGPADFQQRVRNKDKQDAVVSKIEEMIALDPQTKGDRYFISSLGKEVINRPSDRVARYATWLYGNREFDLKNKSLYTTKGTILHKYMQFMMDTLIAAEKDKNIKIRYNTISNDVYKALKDNEEFKDFPFKDYYILDEEHFARLKRGVTTLYDSIKERDPYAKIYTEAFVYDPRQGVNDIGGTIDLLVVYGDGKIGIYDYKSKKLERRKGKIIPIDDFKRQQYDVQLGEYKKMLKNTLQITDKDFAETRIIPMYVEFGVEKELNKKTIDQIVVGEIGATKEYKQYITAAREKSAENESLNVFLNGLYTERENLRVKYKNARGPARDKLGLRIEKLNATINNLLVAGDISSAIEDIKNITDHIYNDYSELNFHQLNEYRDYIIIYRNFNTAFTKELEKIEDAEERKKIENDINYYNNRLDEASQLLESRNYELLNSINELDITKGGKVEGILGTYFKDITEFSNPAVFTIAQLIMEQKEKVLRGYGDVMGLFEAEEIIDKELERYREWAKSKGLSGINKFDPIINKKTGNLITRISSEFYEEKEKIIKRANEKKSAGEDIDKEIAWLKRNMKFDEDAWKKYRDNQQERLNSIKTFSKKHINIKLWKIDAMNPNKNDDAYLIQRNGFIRPKDPSEIDPKYISEGWKELQKSENKPALDFYLMHERMNERMADLVGYDMISRNFVANIHANTVEKLNRYGPLKGVSLFQDFQRALEIREYDSIRGTLQDTDGNVINKIPLFFIDNLKSELTDKEKYEIRQQVAQEYKPGTADYENAIRSRENKLAYEKGVKDKSLDLGKSLKLMYRAVLDYKFKSDVEDAILGIRHLLATDMYTEIPTDSIGRQLEDRLTGTPAEKFKASKSTQEIVDKFIKLHLYGQKIQSKDKVYSTGNRTYSATKAVLVAQNALSIMALGLNPVLAGASFFGAKINKQILGVKGSYFTENSWKEAIQEYTSADDKTIAAIKWFEPSSRDQFSDRALKTSESKLMPLVNERGMFVLHRGTIQKRGSKKANIDNPVFGDDNIDNSILIAMLKNWVLDSDGKVKSKSDSFHVIKDPNAKTLWELFDPQKGLDIDIRELAIFRGLVNRAQKRVKGSLTDIQQILFNTDITGAMFMKFRNWMPGLSINRFGQFNYDYLLRSYEEGHFRTALGEVFIHPKDAIKAEQELYSTMLGTMLSWLKDSLSTVLKVMTEATTFGLYKYKIDEKKAEFFRLKLINKHPEFANDPNFNTQTFINFRKKQIKSFITELRYLLWFVYGVGMLVGAAGWDDQDDRASFFVYKLIRRTGLELDFFWSTQSAIDILKSPIPLMRLFVDLEKALENFIVEGTEAITGTQNPRDKTPFFYYTLKSTPGVNQVLKLSGFFNESQDKTFLEKIFNPRVFEDIGSFR